MTVPKDLVYSTVNGPLNPAISIFGRSVADPGGGLWKQVGIHTHPWPVKNSLFFFKKKNGGFERWRWANFMTQIYFTHATTLHEVGKIGPLLLNLKYIIGSVKKIIRITVRVFWCAPPPPQWPINFWIQYCQHSMLLYSSCRTGSWLLRLIRCALSRRFSWLLMLFDVKYKSKKLLFVEGSNDIAMSGRTHRWKLTKYARKAAGPYISSSTTLCMAKLR